MTRQEALETIYTLINSGILAIDIEDELQEIADNIENDSFESDDAEDNPPIDEEEDF